MKKLCFCLLILLMPLQSLWAAVQAYHGHESGFISVVTLVDYGNEEHADKHHHDSLQDSDHAQSNPCGSSCPSSCEGHHHHCHAHSATVLPSVISNLFPKLQSHAIENHNASFCTCITNQIERPNWV